MAESDALCYINELPDEFAKILDLVPIKHVFADMRVSKRWEDVCRQAVRTRKSLIIGDDIRFRQYANPGNMRGSDRDKPSDPLDKIIGANESLVPMMLKSLKQMQKVKQFIVSQISLLNVREFICKFADQLTLLEVKFAISDTGADVFPHLTHLHCWNFNAQTASAFPELEELLIEELMHH